MDMQETPTDFTSIQCLPLLYPSRIIRDPKVNNVLVLLPQLFKFLFPKISF